MKTGWKFWIDRGGTFTDIVALEPSGAIQTKKLLSENPENYADAALEGIRQFLDIPKDEPLPGGKIASVKMGTTVATNALLERAGEPTALAITAGLSDALEIGYQARPDIFALNILKPAPLYGALVEIDERLDAGGQVLTAPDIDKVRTDLQALYDKGYRALAVVFLHAYRNPEHETQVAAVAREIGFTQISTSHEASPLVKMIARGRTAVVDAYLSPILRGYIDRVAGELGDVGELLFMQSSGGLADASNFYGRNAVLSGPAGGVVGAVCTAKQAGFDKIIGFDMGGTSTDVCHYAGRYERSQEAEIAGVRMRAPMLEIHTVAAGGGSILAYDGHRFLAGPASAGANPGPAAYRRGGPLTVTDINVALGKLRPEHFPAIFGAGQDAVLDVRAAREGFGIIADETGKTLEDTCEGFLQIAVGHMARAIKKISVERGYDLQDYTLVCFGGAGGQHACLVAEQLGIKRIFIHPLAGVLSAYGMGLADISVLEQASVGLPVSHIDAAMEAAQKLGETGREKLFAQNVDKASIQQKHRAFVRYADSDTALEIPLTSNLKQDFEQAHLARFSFIDKDADIIIESINVGSAGGGEKPRAFTPQAQQDRAVDPVTFYSKGAWHGAQVYHRAGLKPGEVITGPAIILDAGGTNIVEPGWVAELTGDHNLIMNFSSPLRSDTSPSTEDGKLDPVRLEIFNNLFMAVAEQMGVVLQNTARSVNIKERLDFSCAVFDASGGLVANAPHMPVHIGSKH